MTSETGKRIAISYSGGMDSTALAIYLTQQGCEVELVMSDTGAELPETIPFAREVATKLGCKLTIIQSPGMGARLEQWGYLLPSFRVRWCTRELKTGVLPEGLAVGICADEAHRIPKAYRPLVDAEITKREARKMCIDAGLVNPCYLTGRSSCSCFCCPFQRVSDWRWLLRVHPDLFAQAEEWERKSDGFTWNKGWRLSQMRVMDESQIKLFPDEIYEACAICLT